MSLYRKTWDDGLEIRELTPKEREQFIAPNHKLIFDVSQPHIMADRLYSQDEKSKGEALQKNFSAFQLTLGAFLNGQFAGWHFGRQDRWDGYMMTNSAVLADFRRKGIYTRLLECALDVTTKMGFQVISSHHHPTNNSVIIPKLKAGFWIKGVHVDERFGTLVELVWYSNKVRSEAFEYRVGHCFPSESVSKLH